MQRTHRGNEAQALSGAPKQARGRPNFIDRSEDSQKKSAETVDVEDRNNGGTTLEQNVGTDAPGCPSSEARLRLITPHVAGTHRIAI
jgi:hypothetical protein